ncbi:hypothetical protein HPB49_021869 [Dermacentor silvarum]|uniref:Uncharacterized protein n=1 Tax=Dermacentor silvarum TaxID=543639 RepID=A0ACB8D0A4_DERSI|nr:hypothetical protein HPB49_021869 [Dermacentor silvarum]
MRTLHPTYAENPLGYVVRQKYSAEVYDEFVISGNTAVMRCQVPGYVTDFVTVTSWIEEPTGNVIKPGINSGASKYHMFPEGELYIRDVDKTFSYRSYRCQTRDKLTGESTRNSLPGRLIVTAENARRPPEAAPAARQAGRQNYSRMMRDIQGVTPGRSSITAREEAQQRKRQKTGDEAGTRGRA